MFIKIVAQVDLLGRIIVILFWCNGAKHPVPISVANSKTITLHFNRMTPDEKQQYAGMFIGGHNADYHRDITYPIISCGGTQFKVSYDKTTRLRTTTFQRVDGTLITETLSFADVIIAADPSIDVIFEWLGYKMIEYLRFIGGDFQQDILTCNNVDTISTVFHALFPSYRFPELKIPLKKIPLTANYVEVNKTNEVPYKEVSDFHRACYQSHFRAIEATINPTLANVPDGDDHTPLTIILKNYSRGPYSLQIVQSLLDNNADPNTGTLIDSNLSKALNIGHAELVKTLMRGATSPHCPTLRVLPKVSYFELEAIIQSHQLALFEEFYPYFLEYGKPQSLLNLAYSNTIEALKPNKNSEVRQREQKNYDESYQIFERILTDSDPNCDNNEEQPFCKAAKEGKLRVLRGFLKHRKLNINQSTTKKGNTVSDFEGWTALHYACWKGHLEIVNALLEAGIEVNSKSYFGQTPLAVVENVLTGKLDFMSTEERRSEKLTNDNLSLVFKENMGERKLSVEDENKFRAIMAALKTKNAVRDLDAENQGKPRQTNFAVAVCITATVQNSRFVILVRKKNRYDQACGMHLFPGGFYDNQRDNGNFTATAIREVREETRIDLTDTTCSTLAVYKSKNDNVHVNRHFFHFDLGSVDRLPFCIANSDIVEAM